jgi:hypothetical protein
VWDRAGTDPTKTSISIPSQSVLPPFCCDCGLATSRFVMVKRRFKGDGPTGFATVLAILFGAITGLFLLTPPRRGGRSGDVLIIRMPQCNACAANGPPEPIAMNSEELRMSLIVHKDFKKKVREATARADGSLTG